MAKKPRSYDLRDMVYQTIRKQISQGILLPGSQMTEAAIGDALGVSRTPVRESFLALAREGLLVKQGRSFILPPLTFEDLQEIDEVRQLLEPHVVRGAVQRMTPAILAELKDALATQKSAHARDDAEEFIAANGRFRRTLFATVSNRRLRRATELYIDHLNVLSSRLRERGTREIVLGNLSQLLTAVVAEDADKAAEIWHQHISDASASARAWLREMNEGSAAPFLPVQTQASAIPRKSQT